MTEGRTTKRSSVLTKVIGVLLVCMLLLSLAETVDAKGKGGRGRSGGSVRHSGGSKSAANRGTSRGSTRTPSNTGRSSGSTRQTGGGKSGANRGTSRGGARTPSNTGRGASPGGPGRSPTAKPGAPGRGKPAAGRGSGRSHRADKRYSSRKSARRDYRRRRAVRGLVRVGVVLATRPTYSTTVVVTGTTYYYAGGVYYTSSGSNHVVVSAPPGAVVYAVPTGTTVVYAGNVKHYYYGGTYYVATTEPATTPESPETAVAVQAEPDTAADDDDAIVQSTITDKNGEEVELPPLAVDNEQNYEVVAPPIGATVTYLPDEVDEKTVDGRRYFVFEGTHYKAFASGDDVIYLVVEDPAG